VCLGTPRIHPLRSIVWRKQRNEKVYDFIGCETDDQMEEDEAGEAFSMRGRGGTSLTMFWLENLKGRDYLEHDIKMDLK